MKYILLLLVFSAVSVKAQTTLEGKVFDSISKSSVPFAEIYILDLELFTRSDVDGHFLINSKLPQQYQVIVSALGYETQRLVLNNKLTNIDFYLTESHQDLEEVTVSGPKGTLQRENAVHIERMNIKDLNQIATTTIGEAIAKIPGVYNSTTGIGISKPVIRGMQGIRVVSLLNGLRIENQQWGGDHGIGVTSLGIGSVEVIKGPASLLYGADALGGVIYYVDENYAAQNKLEVGLSTQNESNTLGTSNQFWIKKSGNNVRFSIAGSLSNHADYQLPSARYAANSRFSENTVKTAFGWNRKNSVLNVRYTYNSTNVGIPGHTHDAVIEESKLKVNQQSRKQRLPYQDFKNHFLSIDNKWFMKRGEVQLLLGQTLNQLTEFDEKNTIPGIKMNLFNSLYHLKYKRNVSEKLNYIVGCQGMFQQNFNDLSASEFLLPKSSMFDNGAYLIGFYTYQKWNFQVGARYDLRIIETAESFKGNSVFNENYNGFNFSFGSVRNAKKYTTRLNISSGYRAPHLSELLANGFHHGALRFEIGDLNLKAEQATQLDLTLERHGDHLEVVLNPFYNYIQHYTYINPIDSMIDGLPAYKYTQMDEVHLYGVDFGFHLHPHFAHWLHLESSYSFFQAKSERQISLMPQNRILTGLKLDLPNFSIFKSTTFVLDYNYFLKQDFVSDLETKTSAYKLVNVAFNSKIGSSKNIEWSIGCKNLFNEMYIDHLSRLKNIGLESPGRNIFFKLTYRFTK